MSAPSWPWRHAVMESGLPATTKHVLLTTSCFFDKDGKNCFRPTRELARLSGLSERAVCTHIAKAVELGWLSKCKLGRRGQRWKLHTYEAQWPEGTDPNSAQPPKVLKDTQKATESDRSEALKQVQQDNTISDSLTKTFPCTQALGGEEFEKLWNEWPESNRPKFRAVAKRLFEALDTQEQAQAVNFAAKYRAAQSQSGSFPAMINFLTEKLFTQFQGAPQTDTEGYFRITQDREEWSVWIDYLRGKFGEAGVRRTQENGFHLSRTRWPEKSDKLKSANQSSFSATARLSSFNSKRVGS